MSIVSTTELTDYLSKIGLDPSQASAAQDTLDGLQRELERYCQRPLEQKERTEVVYPDELGRLWPKVTPIISVSSPEGLYPDGANGLAGGYPLLGGLMFAGYAAPVTITYVGGLVDPTLEVDPVDGEWGVSEAADVKIAILRAASREFTVRHDDTVSVTDLETRETQPVDRQPPGFTEDELKKFDRLRRRTVA